MARAERIDAHSAVGSLSGSFFIAESACSGASQERSWIATLAGRAPRTNCDRLPCLSSMVRLTNCNLRERYEVRNTPRVGICVLKPGALASAASLATIPSPPGQMIATAITSGIDINV
jgi:hypothetical protein